MYLTDSNRTAIGRINKGKGDCMILKRTAAVAAAAAIMASSSVCMGAGVCDISYDIDTNTIAISGHVTGNAKYAALEILKKAKTETDIKSASMGDAEAEALSGLIMHADQTAAAEDGSFTFTFSLPEDAETGTYAARISMGSVDNDQLIYIKYSDFSAALDRINSADITTASQMKGAIDAGKNYLGMDAVAYDKLTDSEKLKIAEKVLNARDSKTGKVFAGSADFLQSYRPAALVEMINHFSSKNSDFEADELLSENGDLIDISSLSSYATYEKQTDSVKSMILSAVCEKTGYTDLDGVKEEFLFQTVNYALYKASGYDLAYEILNDNNGYLGLSFTDYNKVKTKSKVDKKMIGQLFTSKEDIKNKFDDYVDAALDSQSDSSGGGSSGGSGGSVPKTNISVGISTPSGTEGYNTLFYDLDSVEWAKESILKLAEMGIVSGRGNGMYCPQDNVTREEFVKMLVCTLGCEDAAAICEYSDTDAGAWYYKYVASAVSAGIVSGISEERFGTGENISRQDIAVLIKRAAEYKGIALAKVKDNAGFADSGEVSAYAADAVTKVSESGLINGTDKGTFEPRRSATRAETAKILYDFSKLL